MPLEHGKSKAAFGHNIGAELKAGKPMNQAAAIAYSEKGETKDAASRITDAMGKIKGTKDAEGEPKFKVGDKVNAPSYGYKGMKVKRVGAQDVIGGKKMPPMYVCGPVGNYAEQWFKERELTKAGAGDSAPCAMTRARDAMAKITKDAEEFSSWVTSQVKKPIDGSRLGYAKKLAPLEPYKDLAIARLKSGGYVVCNGSNDHSTIEKLKNAGYDCTSVLRCDATASQSPQAYRAIINNNFKRVTI